MDIKIDDLQNKSICMLEKLVALDIMNPLIQRDLNNDRVEEIVNYQLEYHKKTGTFCFLGDLTVVRLDNQLFIVDGLHRFSAIKRIYLHKPDYKICINVITATNLMSIENIFCLLNKSEPVPDYIIKTTNDITKRHILNDFLLKFKKEYRCYISKSKYPKRPNINIDNILDNILESTACKRYQSGKSLFNYFQYVNINNIKDIHTSAYNLCMEKAEKYSCKPLFLSNDIDNIWLNNEDWMDEYDGSIMYDSSDEADNDICEKPAKRKKGSIPKNIRFIVWKKLNGKSTDGICPCCNNNIDINNYECGHIVSRYNGGSDFVSNLLPICSTCNKSMGVQNMNEYCKEYGMNFDYDMKDNIKIEVRINDI